MKNKILKTIPVLAIATTGMTIAPTMTSCSKNDLYSKLCAMPRVTKVEKLDDLPGFESRYLVWFKHSLDWNNESKGNFEQRVEINFRGYDRVNQFFTCGYDLGNFRPSRMNDFEVANRYLGNIIKPEYRFYDKSMPTGLSYTKVDGWSDLTNTNAMEDFHSMITALKTVLSGKWVFSGTSKGGETTNIYAMTYPKDCDVYIPYVAPALYERNCRTFIDNVYTEIGNNVLGQTIADEYRKQIAELQYFLLTNKNQKIGDKTLIEKLWDAGKGNTFTKYMQDHHEYMFDLCVTDLACAFWQYEQDIKTLLEANDATTDRLEKSFNLLLSLAGPDGYCMNSLFFPYFYQACTEIGEQLIDFSQMKKSLIDLGYGTEEQIEALISVPKKDRPHFYWKVLFNDEQYTAWYNDDKVKQDLTIANKLKEWNNTCTVPVFMIFGGADTWYKLRLPDEGKAPGIKRYVGVDAKNAYGRTHYTRISTLSNSQQKEIWAQLDAILK